VVKVQAALFSLGYPPPQDPRGRYGNDTYRLVLAYKRRFNLLTDSGYLDGIVGPKTIAHMDAALVGSTPLPPCPVPIRGRTTTSLGVRGTIPGVTCSSGTGQIPVVFVAGIMGSRLERARPGQPAAGWAQRGIPTGRRA
jgi:hypothetical protein